VDALTFLAKTGSLQCRHIAAIYGAEAYLRRRVREAIQELAIGDSDPGLCVSEFRGPETDMADVFDQLDTPLLFAPRALVVVDDADPLVSAHRPALEAYAGAARTGCVLLLMVKTWPANTRLAQVVKRQGYAVNCAPLREREVLNWCVHYTKQTHRKTLANADARLLVELSGTEMGRLASEIDKLAAYVGQAPRITQDDVDTLVGRQRIRSTWELMDAAADGEAARALSILERLLSSGESPVMIVAAVGWQLRRMVQALDLLTQGQPAPQVCRELRIPSFAADRFVGQLRRLGTQRIRRTYRAVLDVDLGLKGASDLPERTLLERLVVDLCRPA